MITTVLLFPFLTSLLGTANPSKTTSTDIQDVNHKKKKTVKEGKVFSQHPGKSHAKGMPYPLASSNKHST